MRKRWKRSDYDKCRLCGFSVKPWKGHTLDSYPYGWVHDRCNPLIRFFQYWYYEIFISKPYWRKIEREEKLRKEKTHARTD